MVEAKANLVVASHFSALILSQGAVQMGREPDRPFSQPVAQILSTAVPCQVHEDDKARGSFDQCGNGRATALPNYQVAFPMPWY